MRAWNTRREEFKLVWELLLGWACKAIVCYSRLN